MVSPSFEYNTFIRAPEVIRILELMYNMFFDIMRSCFANYALCLGVFFRTVCGVFMLIDRLVTICQVLLLSFSMS